MTNGGGTEKTGQSGQAAARRRRLAAALRVNLQRRKAQVRNRPAGDAAESSENAKAGATPEPKE
jgi:hypothetical protein